MVMDEYDMDHMKPDTLVNVYSQDSLDSFSSEEKAIIQTLRASLSILEYRTISCIGHRIPIGLKQWKVLLVWRA